MFKKKNIFQKKSNSNLELGLVVLAGTLLYNGLIYIGGKIVDGISTMRNSRVINTSSTTTKEEKVMD